jgi:uncharacterized protein
MPEIYHEGELAVQARVGVSAQAQRVGRIISPYLPDGADGFFNNLPILFRGAADQAGDVWASALTGDPGFIRATDSRTVESYTDPASGDPLMPIQIPDGPAGFLAIDLATRQRFRFNGQTTRSGDNLRVKIDQAYGNCPKYIQLREVTVHRSPGQTADGPTATTGTALMDADTDLIRRADTFFIASVADGHGADVSHRGGRPGFVRVTPAGEITFKDYIGNNMFQTLGNLTADPRAGLLFIDFETGSTLQLTGRAVVNWASDQPADRAETGRSVTFQPGYVVRTPRVIPLRWVLRAYSPYNPDENSH